MSRTKPTAEEREQLIYQCYRCMSPAGMWCTKPDGSWMSYMHMDRHWQARKDGLLPLPYTGSM